MLVTYSCWQVDEKNCICHLCHFFFRLLAPRGQKSLNFNIPGSNIYQDWLKYNMIWFGGVFSGLEILDLSYLILPPHPFLAYINPSFLAYIYPHPTTHHRWRSRSLAETQHHRDPASCPGISSLLCHSIHVKSWKIMENHGNNNYGIFCNFTVKLYLNNIFNILIDLFCFVLV